jgi:hypothetical protein
MSPLIKETTMDVRMRLRYLAARDSAIAKDGLNRYCDQQEQKQEEKAKLENVLDIADSDASKGFLTNNNTATDQHWESDVDNINAAAAAAGVAGYQAANGDGDWSQGNGRITLRDPNGNPNNTRATTNKEAWDNWEKGVQRKMEELDDDKSVQDIKLQEMNNQMMNADSAESDEAKQDYDLNKKLRDNTFSTSA